MMRVGPQKPAVRLVLISLAVWGGQVHALGLGAIALQSGLGRPLQGQIPVYGLSADEAGANCVKSRVMTLEGELLTRSVAEVTGGGAGAMLSLRTVESINEPVVNVSVEIGCAGSVKRQYQILLDPVPAAVPMAAAVALAPTERPGRAKRKEIADASVVSAPVDPEGSTSAGNYTSAPPPPMSPAAVVRKPAAPVKPKPTAPAKPKPAAEAKSVLTLTAGDAEIEQAPAKISHRSATALAEPHVETDPAKQAALRTDQASVAPLPPGETTLADMQAQLRDAQAQLRDAQDKLLAAQSAAASAARQYQQEKAALTAAQENMLSGKLVALLGALFLACVAVIGRLLWRRADDRFRQEQAFFAIVAEQEASPAAPLQQKHGEQEDPAKTDLKAFPPAATTLPDTRLEPEIMDFTVPADDFAPAAAPGISLENYGWNAEAIAPTVSSGRTESLPMPYAALTVEYQDTDADAQAFLAADLPPALAVTDDGTQAHAAEVAGMLLAAESWMAEHNPMRAAEVLRPYLDRGDMQSPAPILYLLSLYRTMHDKGQVATALAQLQQAFPAEAAAWSSDSQPGRGMADFPAVHAVVDSLSDTDKLLPYLNSLLLAPEPFDFFTYRDIVRAIGQANEVKRESDMPLMSLDFQ